jgi:hypothetical protein
MANYPMNINICEDIGAGIQERVYQGKKDATLAMRAKTDCYYLSINTETIKTFP